MLIKIMKLIDGIIFSAGLASARYHQNHGQWNADKIQKMLELQKNHGKEMMNNKHSSKDDADKADFDNKAVITDTDSSFSYFAPEISSNTIVINNIHHDNVDSNTNSMMNTSDNSVDVTGVEDRLSNLAKMEEVRHEILAKILRFGINSQKVRHLFQKFFAFRAIFQKIFAFGEKTLRFLKTLPKIKKCAT